jgi:hypothetical protein
MRSKGFVIAHAAQLAAKDEIVAMIAIAFNLSAWVALLDISYS